MTVVRATKIEGWVEALSPIAHFGDEKTGSTPLLRRVGVYVPEMNEVVQIPFVSGNAVRGMLRRLVMHDFFALLGLDVVENPKLYHAFFTGGVLEAVEKGQGEIRLAFKRRLREALPPLSVFGAMLGNQNFPGLLKVGNLFPICREYAAFAGDALPDFVRQDQRVQKSVRRFTSTTFHTRRDDLRAKREEGEQAVQMKVDYEVFIPGTRFYSWFSLHDANDVERAVWSRALDLWRENPVLGGKSSTGDGQVRFEYQVMQGSLPPAQVYLEWVARHKDIILAALNELDAYFGGSGKK